MSQSQDNKFQWKKSFSWVLIANAIYILLFYILMKFFT